MLDAAAPQEGCALLLGTARSSAWRLLHVWPCCNAWPDPAERRRRFAIDPREQLLAQKWARRHQLSVLGTAHSHPDSPPVPSPTDRALTPLRPMLMLIRGPGGPSRAWWLPEADAVPRELQLLHEG